MTIITGREAPELLDIPQVRGLPLIGSLFGIMNDPARFFVKCYREYGPVFRVKAANRRFTVLAGIEAAKFMSSREANDCLSTKEVFHGIAQEYGATSILPAEHGDRHKELRDVLRRGYSHDSIKGRYNEFIRVTDGSLARFWHTGKRVPVVNAMQYMVVDQLGTFLNGAAPAEYAKDLCLMNLYVLNVLMTRQRPRILLLDPRYKRAKARVIELGRKVIADYHARRETRGDAERNFVDDVMEAHLTRPDVMPASDLILNLSSPYMAGLDTVANTTATIVYTVLKHPEVLARVQREVDELFANGDIEESDLKKLPSLQGAIMETMRLYPLSVAHMRTAKRAFIFAGRRIDEGESLYVATSVPYFMEEYYPAPETFDIDRYQKPREEHLQSGAYSVYGRGSHTCLGKSLAEMQIMLSMARVFHKLDLALEPANYQLKTKTTPAPGPALNFKVRVNGYRH